MTSEQLRYDVADRVATITLSRPERLNASTPRMAVELAQAAAAAGADDGVRVVVVTGDGRGSCAGADLGAGAGTFGGRGREDAPARGTVDGVPRDRGGIASLRFAALREPVIAAESARFGFVFACRGWSASARRWSGWPPGGCSTPPRRCAGGWSPAWSPTRSC
ncbi:enoyl-CoA hydratase-related protein [Geodermatophilus sp. SYSU D01119]